jgi:hypothetical protein
MTEREVKSLLGPPAIEEYTGGSMGDSCFAWTEGEQTIAVDFNVEGRMVEKRYRAARGASWIREGHANR